MHALAHRLMNRLVESTRCNGTSYAVFARQGWPFVNSPLVVLLAMGDSPTLSVRLSLGTGRPPLWWTV